MAEFSSSAIPATHGNSQVDQVFANAVALGCSNPSANTNAESRLVVKRQGSTNNNKALVEVLDDSANVLFDIAKDFTVTIKHADTHGPTAGTPTYGGDTYNMVFTTETITIAIPGPDLVQKLPIFRPNNDECAQLGSSTKKFWAVYSSEYYGTNVGSSSSKITNVYCTTIYRDNEQSNSDQRIKESITSADKDACLVRVNALPLKKYKYSNPPITELTDTSVTGLIAQDVKTVIPEAVVERAGTLPDGSAIDDFHHLDKNRIFMECVGAIQRLSEKLDALTTRVAALES
jgi:hypothetical protein